MSDEADMAQLHIERQVDIALANRKQEILLPTGLCYNCDEPVIGANRFCDADCRDDFEKRKNLSLHRG